MNGYEWVQFVNMHVSARCVLLGAHAFFRGCVEKTRTDDNTRKSTARETVKPSIRVEGFGVRCHGDSVTLLEPPAHPHAWTPPEPSCQRLLSSRHTAAYCASTNKISGRVPL